MSITLVPFRVEHIDRMRIQPAQRDELRGTLASPYGEAYTALVDGEPVGAAGVLPIWPGRAYAWALLGENVGRHFVAVHRAVLQGLRLCASRRIEMAVDADFEAGQRWAEMLGFRRETPEPMQAFLPNGRPAYLYARVS